MFHTRFSLTSRLLFSLAVTRWLISDVYIFILDTTMLWLIFRLELLFQLSSGKRHNYMFKKDDDYSPPEDDDARRPAPTPMHWSCDRWHGYKCKASSSGDFDTRHNCHLDCHAPTPPPPTVAPSMPPVPTPALGDDDDAVLARKKQPAVSTEKLFGSDDDDVKPPTAVPTTKIPTVVPTLSPTAPTAIPTPTPTAVPTPYIFHHRPSKSPTQQPTKSPSTAMFNALHAYMIERHYVRRQVTPAPTQDPHIRCVESYKRHRNVKDPKKLAILEKLKHLKIQLLQNCHHYMHRVSGTGLSKSKQAFRLFKSEEKDALALFEEKASKHICQCVRITIEEEPTTPSPTLPPTPAPSRLPAPTPVPAPTSVPDDDF